MIFIVTHKQDYTADFVIDKLNQEQIPYYRYNCEDIENVSYSIDSENCFKYNHEEIRSKIKSVWYRRIKLPKVEIENPSEKHYVLNEYEAYFRNLRFFLEPDVKWLSDPLYIERAENKIYQLQKAAEYGMVVPRTLLTNDKSRVRSFFQRYDANVILKPLFGGRVLYEDAVGLVFTNFLLKDHIQNLEQYTLTPVLFQEYIEKQYEVRVTIVGESVFSAKVDSQGNSKTAVDWRRERITFQSYELPAIVAEKCRRIVSSMNLNFGAIDLIKRSDGEYVFLEINPNGQWAWIENDTGQKISKSIIEFLSSC